ncbi:MAG: peptidoglycan-binding protein [Rhodobacteraceae bacterium]|jgi:putative chitinase|nr:peptidoglycan-binding protein [Paracoccaceae bacterium]
MIPVDGDFIRAVAPRFTGARAAAQERIIGAISGAFAPMLAAYAIDNVLRIAHFMGQVTHECAGFRTTEEFASGAAYEGREDLGNIRPRDGRRYKGRGLIQLTGRANYRRIGGILGLPLEDQPELAADPLTSLRIACEYWKDRQISGPADADDLVTVTRRVNGGLNGLEDRRTYLRRARTALAAIAGTLVAAGQGGAVTVLRRGSTGDAVGEAQALLRAKGFPITVDNDFGPATELAVMEFQRRAGLAADGIIGRDTWTALRA